MDEIKKVQEQLSRPLDRRDVEFRVSRASAEYKRVNVVPYITARGIMQRLDEVFGINGWKDEYEVLDAGVKCKLSIKIGDEWITKEDAAPFTNIEALKGAFSDSLKRVGVKFGIGRYLYDLPEYWVDVLPDKPYNTTYPAHKHKGDNLSGWWIEPDLPEWALTGNGVSAGKQEKPQQGSIAPGHLAKLQQLSEAELITKGKFDQFAKTLSQTNAPATAKKLILSQLDLIEQYGENIIANDNISQADKRDIYKRILSCKQGDIKALEEQIKSLRQEEAA